MGVELKKQGKIGIVTINRPEAMNALNNQILIELEDVFQTINRENELKAVIITGAGSRAFVGGADISQMQQMGVIEARHFSRLGQRVFSLIENTPVVVIAAVNGFALGGGCELAMACDMRFASSNAKFGQPEIGLGIIPGFAGTQRLPRLIGRGHAKELIFTGDMIDAQEACFLGLVNKVYEPDMLMEKALELAEKIVNKGSVAVSLAKDAINKGLDMDDESAYSYEAEVFSLCFSTDDQKEGMTAFVEKRKPEFKGC